jgi:peptide/nickel transport system ATP-binding protein
MRTMESKMAPAVLTVKGLKKYFLISKSAFSSKGKVFLKAVDGISFSIHEGEVFGLVGESGSGKSTTAYSIIGMYPPTEGQIIFSGTNIGQVVTKRPLDIKKRIQIVFQDPGTSLNPQRTIRQILALPLQAHHIVPSKQITEAVEGLLTTVELPADYMYKYPRAIGGGERQMVAIARALATRPSLIVLDEPTSALDVSIQAKIITMLMKLRSKYQLSYLFITHDLSLMRNIATRIAIMYLGRINELAPATDFFQNPLHPYTQMLLSSIPVVTRAEEALKPTKTVSMGEIPSPIDIPPGCGFYDRCTYRMDVCKKEDPDMFEVGIAHLVRCFLYSGHKTHEAIGGN